MSESAIKVEGLCKRYRIGHQQVRYSTLSDALSNAFLSPFRRLKSFGQASHREEDTIWALKDVSFDVAPGEVLGVIGRNGAGKSTLLKILSQITYPTEGQVCLRGRVSSLLEVGTGFHPELTGRENIFLNGAILGMTQKEIRRKFDDIVEFSEIEKFIDTPVKRYSSGMYVRLAFGVAAHLEPEILLVDEVLAVGDFAFRKKCIGKMNDVAQGGRTVLFVSHNMAAIEALCTKTILLENGSVAAAGDTDDVLGRYMVQAAETSGDISLTEIPRRTAGRRVVLTRIRFLDEAGHCISHLPLGGDITFELEGKTDGPLKDVALAIRINKPTGQRVTTCHSKYQHTAQVTLAGHFKVSCTIKNCRLMPGPYNLMLIVKCDQGMVDEIDGIPWDVTPRDVYGTGRALPPRTGTYVPDAVWDLGHRA